MVYFKCCSDFITDFVAMVPRISLPVFWFSSTAAPTLPCRLCGYDSCVCTRARARKKICRFLNRGWTSSDKERADASGFDLEYDGVHEYTEWLAAPYFITIGEEGDIHDNDGLMKCEQRCLRKSNPWCKSEKRSRGSLRCVGLGEQGRWVTCITLMHPNKGRTHSPPHTPKQFSLVRHVMSNPFCHLHGQLFRQTRAQIGKCT